MGSVLGHVGLELGWVGRLGGWGLGCREEYDVGGIFGVSISAHPSQNLTACIETT